MTLEEWDRFRYIDAQALDGRQVKIILVNEHVVQGLLTGVGYAGLRILPPATDREVHYEYRLVRNVAADEAEAA